MPENLLFVFSGTGYSAQYNHAIYEKEEFNDNVIRIYFSGCHDKAIGGIAPGIGYISPNLDIISKKIRDSFVNGAQLSLLKLKEKFGKAIIIEPHDIKDHEVEVDHINLIGFSRGAVTTFAVARHLDDLEKPMRLFAVDPVPGNSKAHAKKTSSEFYKNHDLSQCVNLVEAQVILGAYKNNVNLIHNKFFRQMAPLFSDRCQSSVYLVPKKYHLQFNRQGENQEIDFLVQGGIRPKDTEYYEESKNQMTFTPKIIQQKPHRGVIGRMEILLRYKRALFELVLKSHPLSKDSSVKSAQALYALDLAPQFVHKEFLISIALEDNTFKGKAIREFIVEFENINQYIFRKISNEASQSAMNQFRCAVYERLYSFPIEDATSIQKQDFVRTVLSELKAIKEELPSKKYKELKAYITSFLKDNIVFHPDLTRYLDETETVNNRPAILQAKTNISTVESGDEMAEILYHLSENSRAFAYHQFPKKLHQIITDVEQLGDVVRFLPDEHIKALLKDKEIRGLIKSIDDFNCVIDKLFYPAQQTIMYHLVKDALRTIELDFTALGKLMQHFSPSQCKNLAFSLNFNKIQMNSNKDIVSFFEKLNDQQFNKVFPQMVSYLEKILNKENDGELRTYLGRRITEPGLEKVFNEICSNNKVIIQSQRDLKQQLASEKEAAKEIRSTTVFKPTM